LATGYSSDDAFAEFAHARSTLARAPGADEIVANLLDRAYAFRRDAGDRDNDVGVADWDEVAGFAFLGFERCAQDFFVAF
jgi:hypothetical protein